jgi:hypothetical protein
LKDYLNPQNLTEQQHEALEILKELGFTNIDVSKLLVLSALHEGKIPLTMEHVHEEAKSAIEAFRKKALDQEGVHVLSAPTGFAMANWLIVVSLNPGLANRGYYTTDIDTFSVFQMDIVPEDIKAKLRLIRDDRPRGSPRFCDTFDPVDNSFNTKTFGLDRITDPFSNESPDIIAGLIIERSNQIRMLESLYPAETKDIRIRFERVLTEIALQKEADMIPDAYKDLFVKHNGLTVDSNLTLGEIFVNLSHIQIPLLSQIKLKHITRSLLPEQKFTTVDTYNTVLLTLNRAFGISVKL